jgi:hypothetical protein
MHWFTNLDNVHATIEKVSKEYNELRQQSSLGGILREAFAPGTAALHALRHRSACSSQLLEELPGILGGVDCHRP